MSVADVLEGRHLLKFTCEVCGPRTHETALQVGEVFVCWSCLCRIVMGHGESDDCPMCYPATCPAPGCAGITFANGRENDEHIESVHRR